MLMQDRSPRGSARISAATSSNSYDASCNREIARPTDSATPRRASELSGFLLRFMVRMMSSPKGFIKSGLWVHSKIQQDAASTGKTGSIRVCHLRRMNANTRPRTLGGYESQSPRVDVRCSVHLGRPITAVGGSMAMKISQDGGTRGPSEAEAGKVRALYTRAMDGWNQGSGDAFVAPFAEDADFVAFEGERFRGREELARVHGEEFKRHLKGTRLVGDVTDLRFLTNDIAVMHATGGTTLRGKSEPAPERHSIQTLVAAKGSDEWQIVAFQNTRVRPIGRSVLGTLLWLVSDRLWRLCLPTENTTESQ